MIEEFICPNGRMSVNGVCPIFEGDDGQIKDIKKTSTYNALKEDEIFGEKDVEQKGVFEFDFELPTNSAFESAGNIISNNINAYNSYVQDKLGIPPIASNLLTGALTIATGSFMPIASKLFIGNALNRNEQKRIQNITNKDTQGDINIIDFQNKNDNIAPSAPTKTYSAPQQTAGPGGLHSNY